MPKQRLNDVSDAEIITAYAELNSVQKVSACLGVGVATAARVLKKAGVPMVGHHAYRQSMSEKWKGAPYVGVYTGSTDEILEWYKSGLSLRAIADRIGRSVHVVGRRVRAAGLARPYQGSGPDHSNWAGGRISAGNGYWRQWITPDDPMAKMCDHHGYVKEHRLNMARKLKRPLLSTETVHHIDGDRTNNSPENLELRQGKHGKHVVMYCLDCGSRNIGHAKLGGQT